jgi:hypothetical protein
MKNLVLPFLALPLLVAVSSCQKDHDEAGPDSPVEICGIDGMRLEADLDGSETCFSSSLIANLADGQLSIGGVNPASGTVALLLDDMTVGTHAATDSVNHVLLIISGVAYQTRDDLPGEITISSHDLGSNHIKGSFSAQLTSADGSPAKSLAGTFDVTYLEQ